MALYAATIFVSAFLLFLVQPVIAKQILPWFGGSAAVWTTCLVFFQLALLAGYAYSDWVARRLRLRTQFQLHAALLVVSLAVLPIIPAEHWKPEGSENPSPLILGLLAMTIGLPYFLLSTTSPLVQSWLFRARPRASPYRLFALSNGASMLALLGYPFLLEPWAPTRAQALGWSVGYAVFVALCVATGWLSLKSRPVPEETAVAPAVLEPPPPRKAKRKKIAIAPARVEVERPSAPSAPRQALWVILAATGTLLLLAVSNHITQNIASVPLLWILPLAIYLSTFILCFDSGNWYRPNAFLPALAVGLCVMGWALAEAKVTYNLALQIGVFCAGLFVACMFCHGELARSKPAPEYLTRFYLMVAVGGAGGSALVGIVAPLVLPAYFELGGGLLLAAILLYRQVPREHLGLRMVAGGAFVITLVCVVSSIRSFYVDTVSTTRNFYGVLRVREALRGNDVRRALVYGTIQHGVEYMTPSLTRYPTSYYAPTSGIGRLLSVRPGGLAPRRVGVVGLGIGTIAAYGLQGDVDRFYDINPDVLSIAKRDFLFLKESQATIELVLGDGRLALEREPNQAFDVLVIDAFFGDAIPVHLLTREAIGIYKRHVKPGGVIAFHLTNQFMNLVPVVAALAEAHHLFALHVQDVRETGAALPSDWVLLSDRRDLLDRPKLVEGARPLETHPDWRLWTDDFNNLVQVLK